MVLNKFGCMFTLSRLLPVPSTTVLFLCSHHLVPLLLSFLPSLCQERQQTVFGKHFYSFNGLWQTQPDSLVRNVGMAAAGLDWEKGNSSADLQ